MLIRIVSHCDIPSGQSTCSRLYMDLEIVFLKEGRAIERRVWNRGIVAAKEHARAYLGPKGADRVEIRSIGGEAVFVHPR